MSISHEEALDAQRSLEDKLLQDSNIVSIGVVKETDHFGQKTGDYIIKVGIISAEIYQNALKHNQSIIPREFRLCSKDDSHEVKNVRIKVEITGQIKALSASNREEGNKLPSTRDNTSAAILQKLDDHPSKQWPRFSGLSIGYSNVTAGTLFTHYMNKHPSGNKHNFSNNYPFRIFKRAYLTVASSVPSNQNFQIRAKSTLKSFIPTIKRCALLANFGIYAANRFCNSSRLHSHVVFQMRR
jgi:hypothetical protein